MTGDQAINQHLNDIEAAEANRDKIAGLPPMSSSYRIYVQYQKFDMTTKKQVGGSADFRNKQAAYDWLDENKVTVTNAYWAYDQQQAILASRRRFPVGMRSPRGSYQYRG